jgi:hypothetical protein
VFSILQKIKSQSVSVSTLFALLVDDTRKKAQALTQALQGMIVSLGRVASFCFLGCCALPAGLPAHMYLYLTLSTHTGRAVPPL